MSDTRKLHKYFFRTTIKFHSFISNSFAVHKNVFRVHKRDILCLRESQDIPAQQKQILGLKSEKTKKLSY